MGKKIKTVELEVISTAFVGEVIRLNKGAFKPFRDHSNGSYRIPYNKMSFARRAKLVTKTLDAIAEKK